MSTLTKFVLGLAVAASTMLLAAPVMADWYEGDGHKMHFPQLPDPNGWDVEISSWDNQHECADDWMCSQSGPVSDLHFWYSVADDAPTVIGTVVASIYKDDRTDPAFSKPGQLQWTQSFGQSQFSVVNDYGSGLQGFVDPQYPETWVTGIDNHQAYHQINIVEIQEPFIQTEGEIYWLGLHVYWEGTQSPVGWKTSQNHFEDTAVFRDLTGAWQPLNEEFGAPYPMDFAFVITPEPSTFVLLGMGALGMLFYGWRRRRA